jgi:hypothetical protein
MSSAGDTNADAMALTADLACYEVTTSAKGQKTAAVHRNGVFAFWTFGSAATPLFNPSAYGAGDTSGKQSLCLRPGADVLEQAEALDQWAVDYCILNSERMFGKALNESQVRDRYNAIVRRSDRYPPFVKVKIATDKSAPNYWDANKEPRSAPENWTQCQLLCRSRIVGFWFMGTSFGLSVQVVDAQIVQETAVECPF